MAELSRRDKPAPLVRPPRRFFERHFVRKASVTALPKFTAEARKRWDYIPPTDKTALLNNVWCGECRSGVSMHLKEGEMSGLSLVLHGTCKKCGGEVARVIEPSEG